MKEQTVDYLLRIAMTSKDVKAIGICQPIRCDQFEKSLIEDIDIKNNTLRMEFKDEDIFIIKMDYIDAIKIVFQ